MPACFEADYKNMATEYILTDKELGEVVIRPDARARRLTFRMKEGRMHATVPPGTSVAAVRSAIDELRPRLRKACLAHARTQIDLDYRIDAEFFKLSLVRDKGSRFLSRSELGETQIVCPPDADFADEGLQTWLRKVIVEALRSNAKVVLPPRLYALARRHGLEYAGVKINTSRSRWGSCSARKGINLSCYLMLLPARLMDYVLLHELAHTREMNHGERFWALLDAMTGGEARLLREEMKRYRTELPGD